jgi:hypothetical protein
MQTDTVEACRAAISAAWRVVRAHQYRGRFAVHDSFTVQGSSGLVEGNINRHKRQCLANSIFCANVCCCKLEYPTNRQLALVSGGYC